MFNAPDIFTNIPDIAQIYAVNEEQSNELDQALDQMDSNIFLDKMDEETCARWEKILGIVKLDDDTLNDRRFRIKSKVLERLPYSYRVIIRKLDALCPNGYIFAISEDHLSVDTKLSLKSKKMIDDVTSFFENVIPLNMTYIVSIIFNSHRVLSEHKHSEFRSIHQGDLVEHIFD